MNVHAHVCVSEKDLLNHFKPICECVQERERRGKSGGGLMDYILALVKAGCLWLCVRSQTANISASLHSPPAVSPI